MYYLQYQQNIKYRLQWNISDVTEQDTFSQKNI